MRQHKWRIKKLTPEEQQALHVVAFIMDSESEAIKNSGMSGAEASEITKMTFENDRLKLYEALRAIANWLRSILAVML